MTSHFECFFTIPATDQPGFRSRRQGTVKKFIENSIPIDNDLLIVSCSEASLPGSNLATHELNNDFTGVTQRHAYRRLYDDRADFTFYVNNQYSQIRVFERWMQFIVGEQESADLSSRLNNHYRMMYPKTYKTTIYITKYERTAKSKVGKGRENESNGSQYEGQKLYYSFYNAFPISITSMPVSYDSSSLLKCTVSFTYDRYVCSPKGPASGRPGEPQPPETAAGTPNPFELTPERRAAINAAYSQNLDLGLSSSGTFTNTNLSGVFNGSDPTRVFQQNNLNNISNTAFSGS